MQVIQVEVHRNPETSNKQLPQRTDEEDQPVVEFEDQANELTQAYKLEPEYHEMTEEQEAETVQALTP